ncbi:hypothetical protein FPZ43_02670 [Mucilaginibacter pallidiroseus]|uniref:DoxX family protein n=1 Tax=Mucilaginibacter pallidiroseus TaxID=2599295 RepID=A0A563UJD5_9SPHI|nr:hypothetical protein [Mucilaginibacter pallidiroseus]TWR31398.1 hypothetical protein FPZ43_02670 [Mucilaginibacter pallidiroseus]
MHFTTNNKLHYTLRIAIAMCFVGHGAFGIITKEIWCNYFAVFGIGKETAYSLMPWVGGADILFGVIMLFYPIRAIALWLVIWGAFTAFLRPASGEPFAEFIERAGNFGAPLAMLILSGGTKSFKHLFEPIDPNAVYSDKTLASVTTCLKLIVFMLLMGHGWLNIIEKKGLLNQYASLGFGQPGKVALAVGAFEITAACLVLAKPLRSALIILFIWKIATELFYPHYEVFEWIERGGSYGSILALYISLKYINTGYFARNGATTKPV